MASRIHHSPVLYLQLVKPQHPHHIRDQSAPSLPSPVQEDLPFPRSSIRYSDHVLRRKSHLFTQIPRYEVHLLLCPLFFSFHFSYFYLHFILFTFHCIFLFYRLSYHLFLSLCYFDPHYVSSTSS